MITVELNSQEVEAIKQMCEYDRSNDSYSKTYRAVVGGLSDKLFELTKPNLGLNAEEESLAIKTIENEFDEEEFKPLNQIINDEAYDNNIDASTDDNS